MNKFNLKGFADFAQTGNPVICMRIKDVLIKVTAPCRLWPVPSE